MATVGCLIGSLGPVGPAWGTDRHPPAASQSAAATLKTLLHHLPADVMAGYIARPAPQEAHAITPIERLVGLIRQGQRMGLLPEQGKAIVDIIGCLPLLGRYPHALALFDITSRPLPRGGYRLRDMQAALLLYTTGQNGPVSTRIQALLATYTTQGHSRIEDHSAGPHRYHRLIDSRLPPWAVWEWGPVDGLYVVTFGQGAFERVIATAQDPTASLQGDEWFNLAHTRCKGPAATIECTVNFKRILKRLEEVIPDRPREVLDAIHAGQIQRLVWTVGVQGRAITSYAMLKGLYKDFFSPISDPSLFQPYQLAAIPPEAGVYAIVPFHVLAWARAARDGYLASQGPATRARLCKWWDRLEGDLGINVQEDLISHLGDRLIIHTYPPHPTGVPLLCTFLIEIRSDPKLVRARAEALLARWQHHLEQQARQAENPLFAMRLKRTEDDVWFLQAGLYGPGIAFVDSWIVISYSPEAVRANVAFLRRRAESSPAGQE